MNNFTNTWNRVRELYETRVEPENTRALAELFWRTLLGLTFFGVFAVFGFGVWQFFGVLEDLSTPSGGASTPPVSLDRSNLQKTLTLYDERIQAFTTAQHSGAKFTDPSR